MGEIYTDSEMCWLEALIETLQNLREVTEALLLGKEASKMCLGGLLLAAKNGLGGPLLATKIGLGWDHFWQPKLVWGGTTFGKGGPLLAAKSGLGGPVLATKSGLGGPVLVAKPRTTFEQDHFWHDSSLNDKSHYYDRLTTCQEVLSGFWAVIIPSVPWGRRKMFLLEGQY